MNTSCPACLLIVHTLFFKVSMINIVIPAGNENIKSACGGATLKEISLEESVLHGLEMVTSQVIIISIMRREKRENP